MAKLFLNAGSVCILKYDEAFFAPFDAITINAGGALFSSETYGVLSKHGLKINAGSLDVVDIVGEALNIGDAVIDGKTDYSGKFLVGGDVQITTTDSDALRGATGLYATMIICSESFRFPDGVKVYGMVYRHPDNAVVLSGCIKVTAQFADSLAENSVAWTLSNANALDGDAVAILAQKNVSVHCKKLLIRETPQKQYGRVFKAKSCEIVPDDAEYIEDPLTLTELNSELYDENLYIRGGLTVTNGAAAAFGNFTKLHVDGNVIIPFELLRQWKAVGSANGKVWPYKGELWIIEGQETITHEQLAVAQEGGKAFTLIIDGVVDFGSDVTGEDFACLIGVYNDGVVKLPAKAVTAFNSKIIENNGIITPQSLGELGDGLLGNILGRLNNSDTQNINIGSFIKV
ncbi:MAG: hypothetical protein LBC38_01935 [Oscillospiraceae bacterium]|jgi:hypothetical protein|nr:hypothetical protein [Oscillospiraceae bacterium]